MHTSSCHSKQSWQREKRKGVHDIRWGSSFWFTGVYSLLTHNIQTLLLFHRTPVYFKSSNFVCMCVCSIYLNSQTIEIDTFKAKTRIVGWASALYMHLWLLAHCNIYVVLMHDYWIASHQTKLQTNKFAISFWFSWTGHLSLLFETIATKIIFFCGIRESRTIYGKWRFCVRRNNQPSNSNESPEMNGFHFEMVISASKIEK